MLRTRTYSCSISRSTQNSEFTLEATPNARTHPHGNQAPPRLGNVMHSYAGIGKARMLLGWKPTMSLGQDMQRTHEWFSQHLIFTGAQ